MTFVRYIILCIILPCLYSYICLCMYLLFCHVSAFSISYSLFFPPKCMFVFRSCFKYHLSTHPDEEAKTQIHLFYNIGNRFRVLIPQCGVCLHLITLWACSEPLPSFWCTLMQLIKHGIIIGQSGKSLGRSCAVCLH